MLVEKQKMYGLVILRITHNGDYFIVESGQGKKDIGVKNPDIKYAKAKDAIGYKEFDDEIERMTTKLK